MDIMGISRGFEWNIGVPENEVYPPSTWIEHEQIWPSTGFTSTYCHTNPCIQMYTVYIYIYIIHINYSRISDLYFIKECLGKKTSWAWCAQQKWFKAACRTPACLTLLLLLLMMMTTTIIYQCECFTDHTLAHPLNCRGGVVARLSA